MSERTQIALIDIRKFPPYFMNDSIERQVFCPETETHATVDQVRELLADAEFYIDPHGPDTCPPGLISSARATVKHCRAALAKVQA